jgi:hypothetical protein
MKRLGEVMKAWRLANNLGLRTGAKLITIECGHTISPATLSRIERAQPMEAKTLAAVLRFLLEEA